MILQVGGNQKHHPLHGQSNLQADAVSTFSGSDGLREICDLTGAGGWERRDAVAC